LLTCIISLFRNRPRVHRLARLVDQADGTIYDITHLETSIGKVKSNDIMLPLPQSAVFIRLLQRGVRTGLFSIPRQEPREFLLILRR
jgi:hypothetical protein